MAASTTTVTTRRSSGTGANPTVAQMRDAIEGMPDESWVSTIHGTDQRGGSDGWTVTVTYSGPLPAATDPVQVYPPGVRSDGPWGSMR